MMRLVQETRRCRGSRRLPRRVIELPSWCPWARRAALAPRWTNARTFGKPVECPPVASMAHAVSSPLYQELQVHDFVDRLNHAIGKTPSGDAYQIKDYFRSPLGRATVLDQDVNAPGAMANSMKASLDRFFQHNPHVSRNPFEWGADATAYETSVLQDYGQTRYMAQTNGVSVAPQRYQQLVQALGMPS